MNTTTNASVHRAKGGAVSTASPRDYFDLLKPRVMTLVVFTAFAGLIAAPVDVDPFLAFIAILAALAARPPSPPPRLTAQPSPPCGLVHCNFITLSDFEVKDQI